VAVQQVTIPLAQSSGVPIDIGQQKVHVEAGISTSGENLIDNGSFESGLWNKQAGSCGDTAKDAKYSQNDVADASNGAHSLELTSQKAIACVSSSAMRAFSSQKGYTLAFDYKIIAGHQAMYCIWDGKSCVRKEQLSASDNQWHHYETWFGSGAEAKSFSVYLYAESVDQSMVKIRYDNIAIHAIENDIMNKYDVKQVGTSKITALTLSYSRLNPTKYQAITSKLDDATIILQESFHPGWKATIYANQNGKIIKVQLPETSHFVANGFANGWQINPSSLNFNTNNLTDIKIMMEFTPQTHFFWAAVISVGAGVACLIYLVWSWKKRRH
jgi:hypothetical protein